MSEQFSQVPKNRVAAEPTISDLLDLRDSNLKMAFNCHAIATVQSFNSDNQTVKATINYKKTYLQRNAVTKVYEQVLVDYPLLLDCPVVIMGGGPCTLTFPIAKGDQCLILFNDRDIDNWFSGKSNTGPATARLHSFSDGIALVGLRSLANPISDYDAVRAVLQNGDAMVGVGPSLIKIANEMTTLKTVINGLIDVINTVLGTGSNSGGPVVFAGISSLPAYKTTVGGLLE